MSQDVDIFLAHFGVKGMHWGQRRADKQVYKEARSDVRAKQKLSRATGVGSRKGQRELKTRIDNRIATDPKYAAAVKKVHANQQKARKIIAYSIMGIYGASAVHMIVGTYSPAYASSVNKGKNYLAGKAMKGTTKFVANKNFRAATRKPNPKKSEYWNSMTVKSTGVMVGTGLARLYDGG